MTHDEFNAILNDRLKKIKAALATKAGEYATGGDRLHNFRRSAAITGETPARVCVGFFVKHLTSVLDLVDSGRPVPQAVVDEKVGDAINYLILLEAIFADGRAG